MCVIHLFFVKVEIVFVFFFTRSYEVPTAVVVLLVSSYSSVTCESKVLSYISNVYSISWPFTREVQSSGLVIGFL